MSGAKAKRQKWLCKQRNRHVLRDGDEGVCVCWIMLTLFGLAREWTSDGRRHEATLWLSEPPLPRLELGLCELLSFSGCDGCNDAVTLIGEAFEFRREVHGPGTARRPALV